MGEAKEIIHEKMKEWWKRQSGWVFLAYVVNIASVKILKLFLSHLQGFRPFKH